jgi:hypothetical protein
MSCAHVVDASTVPEPEPVPPLFKNAACLYDITANDAKVHRQNQPPTIMRRRSPIEEEGGLQVVKPPPEHQQHQQLQNVQKMQQEPMQTFFGINYNSSTILLTFQCVNLDTLKRAMLPKLCVNQFLQTLDQSCAFTVARDQQYSGRYLKVPRVFEYLVPYVSEYCSPTAAELLIAFMHIEVVYPVPNEFGLLQQDLYKAKLINASVVELAAQIGDASALRGTSPVNTVLTCINQVYIKLHASSYVAHPSVWFTVPPNIAASLDVVRSTICNAIIGLFGYNRVHDIQQVHLACVYTFSKALVTADLTQIQ